jgi:hypothetical protein
MTWYISQLAQWTVAKREDWQLNRMNRNGWLWLALHAAAVIALLVVVIR